jgi:CheY-like chemotaxis protein
MELNETHEDQAQRLSALETENKKLEREIFKLKEKLQESEKNKGAFLANMSHAIRTPMNAIIGFSELISMETIGTDKKAEYVKIINEKGNQLLTLIDDIIEITKIEGRKLEFNYTSVNLDDFLNEVYSSVIQKKLKLGKENLELILEKNSLEDFSQINTDSGRLQQILNNILFFSIRNTTRGSITFGYSIKEQKYIEFFIKDTSVGFTKDEIKLIFDYFWQFEDISHQRITGDGLGLSIAKMLVEMLGGKIWVESEINSGARYYFTLPIEKSGKAAKLTSPSIKQNVHLLKEESHWKNKLILVVEDDIVNYQFIEAILDKTQVRLIHAENGSQALELCKSIPKIDLILMDLKLPEKTGYEITREIKSIRSEIPIIAQTAFPLSEVREKCLNSGCEDVLSKPLEIELFLSKIDKYLTKD